MSEATVRVGRLPSEFEKAASCAITQLGISAPETWRSDGAKPTEISILNLASVELFNEHVAKLEGFPDSAAALEGTRFLHLPWWMTSIWMPVAAFQPPKDPPIDMGGWPVCLGSSQGLLADLAEVQKLSDMGLGKIPSGYEQMRADYIAFMRSDFEMSDERSIIQWVWRGLHDGAQLARSGSVLMLDMS